MIEIIDKDIDSLIDEVAGKKRSYNQDELGNAERFTDDWGEEIRFCKQFGKWYTWSGKCWKEDTNGQVVRFGMTTVSDIQNDSIEETDEKKKKSILKHAKRSRSRSGIHNMIDLASNMSKVAVTPEIFDKEEWLFPCQNGVVNLKTGELLSFDKDMMITKISPVTYEPNAKAPKWEEFLQGIMQDENGNVKHELIVYLQKLIGYSLSGNISDQSFFFLYGTGKNGKSTFINVIFELLGDYAVRTDAKTFLASNSEGIRSDLARLRGMRFVSASETNEGKQFDEALLKDITGGEKITARFLYQNPFEFQPTFKIFFSSNHKPVIKGQDDGIWRRVRMIPFTVTVPEEKRIKDLDKILIEEELSGILNWAIEGCMKWQSEGLEPPIEVLVAIENYKQEMDELGEFVADCLEFNPDYRVTSKQLAQMYGDWCDDNGVIPEHQNKFAKELKNWFEKNKKDDVKKVRLSGGTNGWSGVRLATSATETQQLSQKKRFGVV